MIKLTPKDFFLNVAVMATLYISAFSLISLLFQYINAIFPKEIGGFRDPYSSGISFALASLIIIFPLYIFFTRKLNQDLRSNKEKRELGIRRWLIFITLFIAGVTIVIDLIVLLTTFLSGEELTVGFLLKVLVILAVIGAGFWYYLNDLKGRWFKEERTVKFIGAGVTAVVLISIISGFFILGSPATQRLFRIDAEKVRNLQSIQSQTVSFWQQKGRLPETLSELEDPLVGFVAPIDTQLGTSYGYQITGALSFELCATFNRESRETTAKEFIRTAPIEPGRPFLLESANWQHGVGETCFSRTIDPDRFPPRVGESPRVEAGPLRKE